jgi:biotin carboxyl carrier protein
MDRKIKLKINGKDYIVEVDSIDSNPVKVLVNGEEIEVYTDQLELEVKDSIDKKEIIKNSNSNKDESSGRTFYSPMPGVIISVALKEGDQVVTGDDVCILEAMKMQQVLKADWSGIVKTVFVSSGDQINDGSPIIELE